MSMSRLLAEFGSGDELIVAAHSRFITATMLPSRQTPDLLLGMWSLIEQLGRVPRRLIGWRPR